MGNKIQIIILAAGHGKRMNNAELPKVLVPLQGKPMVARLLESIAASGVCERPLLVVGQKAEMVRAALGDAYDYVFQEDQLGTGHAVSVTRSVLEGRVPDVMVLYGDHPLVTAETIRKLSEVHHASGSVLTMATVQVSDFDDWRAGFADFGRIVRDSAGNITAIVEKRDATPEQLAIREINPGYYCFSSEWLWKNLEHLQNNNAQKEYYLTDLIGIACSQHLPIASVVIDSREALGVNTAEQLSLVSSQL